MANHRKKKKQRQLRVLPVLLVAITMCVFCIGFLVQRGQLVHQNDVYTERYEALQQEYQDELLRSEQLVEQQEYVNSTQFIEDMARKIFGLVRDDDIVIKAE